MQPDTRYGYKLRTRTNHIYNPTLSWVAKPTMVQAPHSCNSLMSRPQTKAVDGPISRLTHHGLTSHKHGDSNISTDSIDGAAGREPRTKERTQIREMSRDRRVQRQRLKRTCPFGVPTCTGCRKLEPIGWLDDETIELDRQHFMKLITTTNNIMIVRSPAVFREQLFQNLANNFRWVQTIPNRYHFLAKLRDWFNPRGLATAAATDCLLLTQFANDVKDDRCRAEGSKRYAAAIRVLRHALDKPQAASDDDVVSATDALGVCEAVGAGGVSTGFSHDGRAWRQHARGLCALLRIRGSGYVNLCSGRARDIVFNAIYAASTEGGSRRKSTMFGEPRWQRALEANCSGKMWCFLHIICRGPGLLERVDALHSASQPVREAALVLHELLKVQARMQSWLLAWYKELPELPFGTVGITHYPSFVAMSGPRADQFPSVFTFPSVVEAFGLLTYWTVLLFIRKEIYKLSIQPYAISHTTQRQRDNFHLSVYECADALCQSAPFFLTPSADSRNWHTIGGERDLCGSLFWAARWYGEQKDWSKAEYCESVLGGQIFSYKEQKDLPISVATDDWWVMGKVFLLQRLLKQECVGPSSCACKEDPESSSLHS